MTLEELVGLSVKLEQIAHCSFGLGHNVYRTCCLRETSPTKKRDHSVAL